MPNRGEVVADIVDKGSDVRVGLRRLNLTNQELGERLAQLYRMTSDEGALTMYRQTKKIAAGLGDALTRAETILASNLLKDKEQERKDAILEA